MGEETLKIKLGDMVVLRGRVIAMASGSAVVAPLAEATSGCYTCFLRDLVLDDAPADEARIARRWVEMLCQEDQRLQAAVVALTRRVGGLEDFIHPTHGLAGPAGDELRDSRGRVVKSKTEEADPQADWLTARPVDPTKTDDPRVEIARLRKELEWRSERPCAETLDGC